MRGGGGFGARARGGEIAWKGNEGVWERKRGEIIFLDVCAGWQFWGVLFMYGSVSALTMRFMPEGMYLSVATLLRWGNSEVPREMFFFSIYFYLHLAQTDTPYHPEST